MLGDPSSLHSKASSSLGGLFIHSFIHSSTHGLIERQPEVCASRYRGSRVEQGRVYPHADSDVVGEVRQVLCTTRQELWGDAPDKADRGESFSWGDQLEGENSSQRSAWLKEQQWGSVPFVGERECSLRGGGCRLLSTYFFP